MPAPSSSPDSVSPTLKNVFLVGRLGLRKGIDEGGNQTVRAQNATCISIIYSDKFSSEYFLYYQTLYPSVKTFVLAE